MGPRPTDSSFMAATHRKDIEVDRWTLSFTARHGRGTSGSACFFTPGTTAQIIASTGTRCGHWGVLFEGPVRITTAAEGEKTFKYLLLDLYVSEIRVQGLDDRGRLMSQSGLWGPEDMQNRFEGPAGVVTPEFLGKFLNPENLNMLFMNDGNLKPFNMGEERPANPSELQAAMQLTQTSEFQNLIMPNCRKNPVDILPYYKDAPTTNCKRFALIIGQLCGLKLPSVIQAFALLTHKKGSGTSGHRPRALERYAAQCLENIDHLDFIQ